jgi:hypothetical protein
MNNKKLKRKICIEIVYSEMKGTYRLLTSQSYLFLLTLMIIFIVNKYKKEIIFFQIKVYYVRIILCVIAVFNITFTTSKLEHLMLIYLLCKIGMNF